MKNLQEKLFKTIVDFDFKGKDYSVVIDTDFAVNEATAKILTPYAILEQHFTLIKDETDFSLINIKKVYTLEMK